MRTGPDKIRSFDRRMSRLMSEGEDVEEIVRDTKDTPMSEVEFLFPCGYPDAQ